MKPKWVRLDDETPPDDEHIIISVSVKDGRKELELCIAGDVPLWDGDFFKATHWLKGLEHPK